MGDTPKKRQSRVRQAKKKIVSLIKQGVRINLKKASDFTVQATPGIEARREMETRAMNTAGNAQSGRFDNSVQLASRKKSSGHR